MTPDQLQKWLELFQEFRTPKGSLDIDCFSLSNAVRSVSFPNADEAVVYEMKRKNKIRLVDENAPNMVEGQKIWLLNCRISESLVSQCL